MSGFDAAQSVLMGVLLAYCAHLHSRLDNQSRWLMNHSGWLKNNTRWLKALTLLAQIDLPEEHKQNLEESMLATPEDTVDVSMRLSDESWVKDDH